MDESPTHSFLFLATTLVRGKCPAIAELAKSKIARKVLLSVVHAQYKYNWTTQQRNRIKERYTGHSPLVVEAVG